MTMPLSKLEVCVSQYDVLARIARELSSTDLFNLALVSKTTWTEIFSHRANWINLNKLAWCDGYGARLVKNTVGNILFELLPGPSRSSQIDPLEVMIQQTGNLYRNQCTTNDLMKPCENCGFMVCDSCRNHLQYSVCISKHGPPIILYLDDFTAKEIGFHFVEWWEPDLFIPHDDGSLKHNIGPFAFNPPDPQISISALSAKFGPWQPINGRYAAFVLVINMNLGQQEITRGQFADLIKWRKRYLCTGCIHGGPGLEKAGRAIYGALADGEDTVCSCNLKEHFIDRWLCLRCAQHEIKVDKQYHSELISSDSGTVACPCGNTSEASRVRSFCSWCGGRIQFR